MSATAGEPPPAPGASPAGGLPLVVDTKAKCGALRSERPAQATVIHGESRFLRDMNLEIDHRPTTTNTMRAAAIELDASKPDLQVSITHAVITAATAPRMNGLGSFLRLTIKYSASANHRRHLMRRPQECQPPTDGYESTPGIDRNRHEPHRVNYDIPQGRTAARPRVARDQR